MFSSEEWGSEFLLQALAELGEQGTWLVPSSPLSLTISGVMLQSGSSVIPETLTCLPLSQDLLLKVTGSVLI